MSKKQKIIRTLGNDILKNSQNIISAYLVMFKEMIDIERSIRPTKAQIKSQSKKKKRNSKTRKSLPDSSFQMKKSLLFVISQYKAYLVQELSLFLFSLKILVTEKNILHFSFKKTNKELNGGGKNPFTDLFYSFLFMTLASSLVAANYEVATSSRSDMVVDMNVHFLTVDVYKKEDQIHRRGKPFQNIPTTPGNEKDMEMFIQQYTTELIHIHSTNLNTNISHLNPNSFLSYFSMNSFESQMTKNVKELNSYIKHVYSSLNTMCERFTTLGTQTDLPLELYKLFNDELEKQDINQEIYDKKIIELGMEEDSYYSYFFGNEESKATLEKELQKVQKVQKESEIEKNVILMKTQEALNNVNSRMHIQQEQLTRTKFLNSFCDTIPLPKFSYKNDILSISNNAKSLKYLQVLADNVLLNKNEEIVYRNTDEDKQNKIHSLVEKAEMISKLVENHNVKLFNAMKDVKETENMNEFIELLNSTWISMNADILAASERFPITKKQKQIERDNKIELANQYNDELITDYNITANFVKTNMDGIGQNMGVYGNAFQNSVFSVTNTTGNILIDVLLMGNSVVVKGFGPIFRSIFLYVCGVLGLLSLVTITRRIKFDFLFRKTHPISPQQKEASKTHNHNIRTLHDRIHTPLRSMR